MIFAVLECIAPERCLGCVPVFEASGQPLRNPQPSVDLGQHQNADIGRQLASIEGDVNRLAADRWKPRLDTGNLSHDGCNSL